MQNHKQTTTSGLVKLGQSCVNTWCKQQACIALSSAEADLYALNRCAAECLGSQTALADWGLYLQIKLYTDASATRPIVLREGLGRMKYIEVQHLWLQNHVETKKLTVYTIERAKNGADLMTHSWAAEEGHKLMPRLAPF